MTTFRPIDDFPIPECEGVFVVVLPLNPPGIGDPFGQEEAVADQLFGHLEVVFLKLYIKHYLC